MNLSTLALIPGIQGWDYIIILAILLLLFGAKKLPELAQGMGKGIREFKKAATEAEDTFREAADLELDKKAEKKPEKSPAHDLKKENGHA